MCLIIIIIIFIIIYIDIIISYYNVENNFHSKKKHKKNENAQRKRQVACFFCPLFTPLWFKINGKKSQKINSGWTPNKYIQRQLVFINLENVIIKQHPTLLKSFPHTSDICLDNIFHGPATDYCLPYNVRQHKRVVSIKVKYSNLQKMEKK